ncbi:peptide ligase PGM1-related protein [Gordonia sp. CPCC 206044]|uniref:preATP grasp domain-containing protein n=1 Tax=Gordonia sp. CPCC 206044 TaxID=3140793 RepID=UPI003AF35C26
MASILIGNVYTEQLAGDPLLLSPHQRLVACALSQRMLWFAQDGDIVVLPRQPGAAYMAYIATLADFDPTTVTIIVPPAGYAGDVILTGDRLTHPSFVEELRRETAHRDIHRILPYFTDTATADMARSAGISSALPGAHFFSQGGGSIANSKALFRCVAAGIGIPIAAGETAQTRDSADRAIAGLIGAGHSVIVKQEHQASSEGNLILSPRPNTQAQGALSVTHIDAVADIEKFLDDHWNWLSNNDTSTVIIERYIEHARSVYAEYLVTDYTIGAVGTGQLLMAPILAGVVIPAGCLTPTEQADVSDAALRLCKAYQAMGYRGIMSVDAVVSPDGDVYVHETNSRISGATYLHKVFTAHIAGSDRVLIDRERWEVSSFDGALRALTDSGLTFDFATRRGIIITADSTWIDGTVRYVLVGVDLDDAYQLEAQLHALSAGPTLEEAPVAATH